MELTLDQVLQKGIEAHKAGKVQEADQYYTAILKANPKHPDANHNMGVIAVSVGKVELALPFFKTALEANPSIAQFWLSYIDALIKLNRLDDAKSIFDKAKSHGAKGDGFDQIEKRIGSSKSITANTKEPPEDKQQSVINLYNQGQLQQALEQAKMLLQQFPNSIFLYNVKGAADRGLGQLDAAIDSYEKAISLKPDYAEAYNNMGNTLKDQGKSEEAVEAFKRAIRIEPNYAEAYSNMGNALKDQGNLEEAITACNRSLSIKPDHAEAYNNMGAALLDQGKLEEAIEAYIKAISVKPEYAEAYNNLGIALQGTIFTKPNRDLQNAISYLLDGDTYIRPSDIADAAISLLKLEENLQEHLTLVTDEVIESPLDVVSDLHELPLLIKLMSFCPLPDLELEGLFIKLRFSILSNISSLKEASPELLRVQSAIALQCFTNEYIYSYTEEEEEILQSLDASIKKVFQNKEQPSPQVILTLASYKALNEYAWCNFLVVTDEIHEVFIRQVEEPQKEKELRQEIPILDEIADRVSSKVRAQYEESPYPRWVKTSVHTKPISIKQVLANLDFNLENGVDQFSESPQILIAGCGTGQHSIGTASRFKNSHVTAIDLSLSSLSYAKRKTIEYGITNIEYIQADILNLQSLGKQFDIVESVGVLHHMKDPMSGWRTLVDCLKPGGLMKIGLYGEVGRKHIVKARDIISNLKINKSPKEMLVFREFIKTSKDPTLTRLHNEPDFYSTSNCRDLIFHVQEHRFTAPQLFKCIEALNLVYLGFEYPSNNEKERGQKNCPDWMRGINRNYSDELDFPRQAFWLQKK